MCVGLLLVLAACATKPITHVSGHAPLSYHLSPDQPMAVHPDDTQGGFRLIGVAKDGVVTFEYASSGKRFECRPKDTYFKAADSNIAITVDFCNPYDGTAEVTVQVVP